MKEGYRLLGDFIQPVDERNRDLRVDYLLGVSISKQFIPSIANIVGTDLSNYKIIRTGQFAYGPVTSRNGEKISIALLRDKDCIISSSYTVFEVVNKNELDPEYLMLWFSRPEFDRYARYMSHGSVREIFDWDELCKVELPVPSIDKQRSIVRAYQTITERIELKRRLNDNLEAQTQALFDELFLRDGMPDCTLSEIANVNPTRTLSKGCIAKCYDMSCLPTRGCIPEGGEMKAYTILIITDRTDLDDQLSKQFVASKKYIGDETVVSIDSREKLRQELQGRTSGGVYMTTIQKFTEDLELLTDRANVICISDEAHRSQINLDQKVKVTAEGVERTYGFAKYLHDSLPNATYVGFTGTPVDGTIEVFGPVVDAYTMTEAVKDGITVNLVYDGRAARVTLDQAKVREIEDYYDRCAVEGANEHQIEESQKAVAHIDAIIGDPDRLHAVAEDFINHYETRVAEGATVAGKAMFVCSNRKIAYAFYQIIVGMRPEWAEKKVCPDGVQLTEKEKKELKPIEKIKLIMTRNKDDEPELYEMLGTKDDRKEFDRQFKNVKSNFKIAIVVDMWLTGFDVPALDTIYIDKPIQQHTLIQTISRVNRVYTGKDKGLIVDYIGIKKNMNLALKKYTNFETDEFEGVEQSVTIVKDQLDVLAQMFRNFNSTDYFNGSPKEQLACLNRAVEYVQLTEDLETRFMAAVKRMKQAFNLCSSSDAISDREKDYLHFYCAVRSILFKLTKGDAPDISQMNARVRELLEGAIQSDGIEELFETGKHISVDIFSDEYLDKINAIQLPNTKIKVLQRLLSQAIDEYKKVNRIMGMEFSDRLKRVVDEYNNRRRDEAFANEVLDDVAEQLAKLLEELKKEKDSFKGMGIDYEEKAFYDILKAVAKKYEFEYPDDKMIELSKRIKVIVDDKAKYTDWSTRDDIKANLQVDLILLLDEFDYPPVTIDDVYKEVLEQAENFKKYSE